MGRKIYVLYAKIIPRGRNLNLNIRLMEQKDIPQVTEIDREAFPTLWPPANYERELKNGLAHYIVASDEGEGQHIMGFAGLWLLVDEAHITNIAVREKHRRQGIGEALLIAIIELAIKLGAHLITLEVRASNDEAQKLYAKYGFVRVGLRRGYYTDNREDAVLMSIENVKSAAIELERLKRVFTDQKSAMRRA